jgi:hypothetical protein
MLSAYLKYKERTYCNFFCKTLQHLVTVKSQFMKKLVLVRFLHIQKIKRMQLATL